MQANCTATTPVVILYVMMCIIGFGNGAVMGAFTEGIQNNLPQSEISGGTATLQCLQSLAGTIGLSAMGLILNNNFTEKLANVVPAGLTNYVAETDLAAYKNAGALLNRAATNEYMLSLPEEAQGLFATMIQNISTAYSQSLHVVFYVLLCLLAVALISMILLKEKKGAEAKQ